MQEGGRFLWRFQSFCRKFRKGVAQRKAATALLDYRFSLGRNLNYSIYGFRQPMGMIYTPSLRWYANCPTAVNTILNEGAEVVKIIEIRKCFRKKSVI